MVPQEFFDRLPAWPAVPLPTNQFAPVGMPVVAWHPYTDVGDSMVESPAFNGTVNQVRPTRTSTAFNSTEHQVCGNNANLSHARPLSYPRTLRTLRTLRKLDAVAADAAGVLRLHLLHRLQHRGDRGQGAPCAATVSLPCGTHCALTARSLSPPSPTPAATSDATSGATSGSRWKMAKLEALGLAENTAVVVFGDHG
jgi:hypothetical protein